MRVLLTNDDGVMAAGITQLREVFAKIGQCEVYVAAPDRERSASGHAITMHRPLWANELPTTDADANAIWAISGTPADCTKLALRSLMDKPPDLVVSGINRGPNLALDVFYSGTVSAAVEACMLGYPAIAISLAGRGDMDYAPAARFALRLARLVATHGLPHGTILNVNVPALPEHQISGVEITRLGKSPFSDAYEKRTDPKGQAYYWLTAASSHRPEDDPDTDISSVRAGKISVTPLIADLTHHRFIEELRWMPDKPVDTEEDSAIS